MTCYPGSYLEHVIIKLHSEGIKHTTYRWHSVIKIVIHGI